jgi:hypothetical protein
VELFSITCTTCSTRLKVRDRAVIGQILACPKCNSMVMVEPPSGWTERTPAAKASRKAPSRRGALADTAPAPLASPASVIEPAQGNPDVAGSSAIRDDARRKDVDADAATMPGELETSAEGDHADAAHRAAAADLAATIDQPIETQLERERDNSNRRGRQPPALPKKAAPQDSEPVLPGDEWVSSTNRRWQQIALVVGGCLAGLLMAVALFGYAISRGGSSTPQVASGKPQEGGSPDGEPPSGVNQNEDDDLTDGDSPHENDSDGADSPAAAQDEDGGLRGGGVDAGPTSPGDPRSGDPTANSGDETASDKTDPSSPAEPDAATPVKPVGPLNPFDLDAPTRPTPSVDPDEPDERPSGDKPSSADSIAEDLGEFAPFLDDSPLRDLAPLDLVPTSGDAADKAVEDLASVEDVSREPLVPRPEPRDVDVAAQLAVPIMGLQFESVALIDYLRFLSQLSAVPITVEPEALFSARVSPSTPVSIKLTDTSIREALESVLRSHGLGYVESDGHVRVVPPSADGGKPRTVPYSVPDLVGDDFSLNQFAEMVTDLLQSEAWPAKSGGITLNTESQTLVVTASAATHLQMLVLCEKLRIARGGKKRSSYPDALFDLRTRREQAADNLARPLTINYVRPTPLVEIVARLEKESGLCILIDWQAIAEQGWNPDGEATLIAEGHPLGEALTSMLEPMDLSWRAVSADILQITTAEALAAQGELEFYAVSGLLEKETPDELIARIERLLGGEHFRSGGGCGSLQFDARSKYLVAVLPQPQQVDLTAILKTPPPAAE